jgi:hypothetical protein
MEALYDRGMAMEEELIFATKSGVFCTGTSGE